MAGHLPHPVLLDDEGVVYLEGEGPPVGLIESADYTEHATSLPERFVLALLSDGILELLGDGSLIEKEALLLSRVAGPLDSPRVLADRLGLGAVDANHLPDDVAALFITRGFN